MMRVLLAALFLEVGAVLTIVPWSSYWDRNYFAQVLPMVHAFVTNDFVRGAVTGLGVVNIAAAVGELVSLFAARRAQQPTVSLFPTHVKE
jgi:TctA family transporter